MGDINQVCATTSEKVLFKHDRVKQLEGSAVAVEGCEPRRDEYCISPRVARQHVNAKIIQI